jgi:hypothetical protein
MSSSPTLGPGNKTKISAKETSRFAHSQEISNAVVGWEDDGSGVLGIGRNFACGLRTTQDNIR